MAMACLMKDSSLGSEFLFGALCMSLLQNQTRVKNFRTGVMTLNLVSPGGKCTKSPALISTGSAPAFTINVYLRNNPSLVQNVQHLISLVWLDELHYGLT